MLMRKPVVAMAAVGLALLMLASCAMFEKAPAKPEAAAKNLPDVREFGDILVPREMNIDKESSAIHSRDGMSVGLLRLAGRVEQNSLIRYFQNNMANEGWRQLSLFRSPHSLLVIEDGDFETFADVWVVPMNESIDALAPK
jgi:hypothetical protein